MLENKHRNKKERNLNAGSTKKGKTEIFQFIVNLEISIIAAVPEDHPSLIVNKEFGRADVTEVSELQTWTKVVETCKFTMIISSSLIPS